MKNMSTVSTDLKSFYSQFDLNLKLCRNPLFDTPLSYRVDKAIYVRKYKNGENIRTILNPKDHIYLKKTEDAFNPSILKNFRDGTSQALIGSSYPGNIFDREPHSQQYQKGFSTLEERWLRMSHVINPFFLNQVTDNTIGNPLQFNFRPEKITTEYLYRHIYYVAQIFKLTDLTNKKDSLILELGGGYGGLAKLFFDFSSQKLTYIIIDLPLSLLLEEYFLSQTFPGKKIGTSKNFLKEMADEQKISRNQLQEWDIVLLPPPFASLIEDFSIDLSVNTHSLMEMNVDQIFYYYHHITRMTKGYFYQCNRKIHKVANIKFTFDDWPIDSSWETVYSEPQWAINDMMELCLKKKAFQATK